MSGDPQTVHQRAQVTVEQLQHMSAEEIIEAQDKGRLNTLLGRPEPGEGTP